MSVETVIGRHLGGRIIVLIGDLTDQAVDAIVNAANASLLGGGGVDGAIHRRGGPAILEACRAIRATRYPKGLPTGEAVITTAGELPARHVIHTVGPIYGQHRGDEPRLLANCYRRSIEVAREHELATIAFPAISTGVYGYPADEAAVVVSRALSQCLAADDSLAEVRLVFFSRSHAESFVSAAVFGQSGESA
ncbi:O-acetyl-ADP-ribose deacetylase [Aromatoleum sp.]|uniref:O-acetyl-ADP-ribose deacetylase n=1 Tax=Aromatoleum sp. TaxID=2307007 RepID=UPI002FC96DBD